MLCKVPRQYHLIVFGIKFREAILAVWYYVRFLSNYVYLSLIVTSLAFLFWNFYSCFSMIIGRDHSYLYNLDGMGFGICFFGLIWFFLHWFQDCN